MQTSHPIRQYIRKTKGSNVSVYGALSSKQRGFKWYATKESSNAVGFLFFLKWHVIDWPRDPQRTIIVMDNISYHEGNATWYDENKVKIRVESISKLIEDAGINVLFLPPYSSELNPIGESLSFSENLLGPGN